MYIYTLTESVYLWTESAWRNLYARTASAATQTSSCSHIYNTRISINVSYTCHTCLMRMYIIHLRWCACYIFTYTRSARRLLELPPSLLHFFLYPYSWFVNARARETELHATAERSSSSSSITIFTIALSAAARRTTHAEARVSWHRIERAAAIVSMC